MLVGDNRRCRAVNVPAERQPPLTKRAAIAVACWGALLVATSADSDDVKLAISVRQKAWMPPHSCSVKVDVRATTARVGISAALQLQRVDVDDEVEAMRDTYWAPVDLPSGKPLLPNTLSRLPPFSGKLACQVSACELLWSRSISSTWPAGKFGDTVPSGMYRLSVAIELVAPDGHRQRTVSNHVLIEVPATR
jgi:hypothetical protein